MTRTQLTILTWAVLAGALLAPAQAEGPPADSVKTLQGRSQMLSHLTFGWQRADKEQTFCSLSPSQLTTMRTKSLAGMEADYRRQGMTDNAKIKHYAEESTQSIMTALGGGTANYTNIWMFQRDGSTTLVSGTTQTFNGLVSKFRQYYNADLALTVFDKDYLLTGERLAKLSPMAWRTSGDSLSYPASSSVGLDVSPELLTFLIGTNPLSLRGLNWKIQSRSPTLLVLNSTFVQNHTNYGIKMALAVKNDFTPTQIVVQSTNTVERFTASHFRRYKNTWISDQIKYNKSSPGFVHEDQTWKLQTLAPSSPLRLKIAGNQFVRDYRLVGINLDPMTADKAGMRRDSRFNKIVSYRWTGKFPSDTEVSRIHEKQHPGEASPDIGQVGVGSSASAASMTGSVMPFAGGVLCLVGGVWMFKQRKAN